MSFSNLKLNGWHFTACFLFSFILTFARLQADSLRIASMNIVVDYAADIYWNKNVPFWNARRLGVLDFVDLLKADVLAVQEGMPHQVEDLIIGTESRVGIYHPFFPDSAMIVNTERLAIEESGEFWLSERPTTSFSVDYDNIVPRVCVWALLRDRQSAERFLVFANHFDARRYARAMMANKLREIVSEYRQKYQVPAIILGDFNIPSDSSAYSSLLGNDFFNPIVESSYVRSSSTPFTFENRIIDHIFMQNDAFVALDAKIVETSLNGKNLSDHNAIYSDISIQRNYSRNTPRTVVSEL